MSISNRARTVALLAVSMCPSLVAAQTIEIYAGGRQFTNTPALQVPLVPGPSSIAPDGRYLVTNHFNGQLLRFDPIAGTATALPGLPDTPAFENIRDVSVNANGIIYAVFDSMVVRLDLGWGNWEFVAGGSGGASTHCFGHSANPVRFRVIADMTTEAGGNLYVADSADNSICRVSPYGTSDRLVGNSFGSAGFSGDGGPAQLATVNAPKAVATDAARNVYIADTGNARIRKVSYATGTIATIAGTGNWGYNGDGIPALSATLSTPTALVVDDDGNVYFFDSGSQRVRRIAGATGLISTVAGNGTYGYAGDGGSATASQLSDVDGLSIAANGDLYISDTGNKRVRRVAHDTGIITTVLGTGEQAFCGESGPRRDACLHSPQGLAIGPNGSLLLADAGNGRVRSFSFGSGLMSTLAGLGSNSGHSGDEGPAVLAGFGDEPKGLARDDSGNIYIAGGFDHRIRRIDQAGIITTVIGYGVGGYSGEEQLGPNATLNYPTNVVADHTGTIYFSDTFNHRVRALTNGHVFTVVGNGFANTPLGDGGPATSASLSSPGALALDPFGNLLIVDTGHARLRRYNLESGLITTIAGNGSTSMEGDGGAATSASIGNDPKIALDPGGNVFIASGYRLRRIDAGTGIITEAVQTPWGFYTPEGKTIQNPSGMAFAADGSLYIADSSEQVVFRVSGLALEPLDTTPPIVEAEITGTLGNDGWYRSDVQITWKISDPDSPIETQPFPCGTYYVTEDTPGVGFACSVRSAGGSTAVSAMVKRDTTPPTIGFGTPTPSANANGWYNSQVSIPYTVIDEMSGAESTGPNPLVLTNEGANLTYPIDVQDRAGNSAVFHTPPVSIDRSPPTITSEVFGSEIGENGWQVGDATQVRFHINETPSSILSESEDCGGWGTDEDTAGVTITCTVVSGGGIASKSVFIKRDNTPPVLTFGAIVPAPNANGWNKANVTVAFTRSDALSGIASTSTTSPLRFNAEGANQTRQVTVKDLAGNTVTYENPAVNIDKTAPYAEMETPVDAATYGLLANIPADFVCEDLAIDTCIAPVALGAFINTATAGSKTFKVTATNKAGLVTNHTHSYNVASTLNFGGFLSPLRAPNTVNLVNRGSLVPLRWRLPDGQGGFVTNSASFVSATVSTFTCTGSAVTLNDTASGPAGLSFDAGTGTFTYNWATGAGWTGCRKLVIKLKDNSTHEARFRFQ